MSIACARRLFACTLLALAACGSATDEPPPAPDTDAFAQSAYPVLLRDCAFPECHASSQRFLQVYGPGRVRLDAKLDVYDPATPAELQLSYERARSMLSSENVQDSLLLRKPLAAAAGGSAHKGADEFGRNVYRGKQEPGYQALLHWAQGMQPPAAMP